MLTTRRLNIKLVGIEIMLWAIFSSCNSQKTKDDIQFVKTIQSDGRIDEMGMLLNGKREGLWVGLSPNAKLTMEQYYNNNLREGACIINGDTSELYIIETYHQDKRHGYTEYRGVDGLMHYKGYYKNGEPDSLWHIYVGGELARVVQIKNGKSKILQDLIPMDRLGNFEDIFKNP